MYFITYVHFSLMCRVQRHAHEGPTVETNTLPEMSSELQNNHTQYNSGCSTLCVQFVIMTKCPAANLTMTAAVLCSGVHLNGRTNGVHQIESDIPQVRAMGRRHAVVKTSKSSIALGYGPLTKRKLMLPSLNSSGKGRLVQRTT